MFIPKLNSLSQQQWQITREADFVWGAIKTLQDGNYKVLKNVEESKWLNGHVIHSNPLQKKKKKKHSLSWTFFHTTFLGCRVHKYLFSLSCMLAFCMCGGSHSQHTRAQTFSDLWGLPQTARGGELDDSRLKKTNWQAESQTQMQTL